MAKSTVTVISDDIDGSANATPIAFSFDGVSYSIDLAKKNRVALEKALKPYLAAATRVKSPRSSAGKRSPRREERDLGAIRAWAQEQGLKVSARGRIPANVTSAYDEAH